MNSKQNTALMCLCCVTHRRFCRSRSDETDPCVSERSKICRSEQLRQCSLFKDNTSYMDVQSDGDSRHNGTEYQAHFNERAAVFISLNDADCGIPAGKQ